MDYQSAQQSYDLALKEYEKLLNAPQSGSGSVSPATRRNTLSDWRAALSPAAPANNDYLNGARGRLDASRSALELARTAQQGRMQGQYGKLTGQASDALYGGVLGYNPKPMTAMGGQQFTAPQGDLQTPFSSMQGLLGQSQRPQMMQAGQMGGMGDMMQPKMRMY